jgi:kynurenine formamidase
MTKEELDAIWERTRNWGRWGADDERGALNFLTPELRRAASASVRDGAALSLAHDLPTHPSVETPGPAHHHMLAAGDARGESGIPGYEASRDYIGTEVHGLGLTHIDALCHMFVRGRMYNGFPAEDVRSTGAARNSIMALADGLIGRGVLLDVPAALGVPFLEGRRQVRAAELEEAERAGGVAVGEGDILLVSTGRDARRAGAKGGLNPFTQGLAGLHPECLPWLHERRVAALGSDGISDVMPPLAIPDWPFPIHQIGITGIGLHLIDNLNLAELAEACRARRRWSFLFASAPIRVRQGTGSPLNPVAVF